MIVVGTHMDLIPRTEKEEKVKTWKQMVEAYKMNRAHSYLYPSIMGICFVGLPKRGKQIGVDGLADCIYDVAMKMEVPNGNFTHSHVHEHYVHSTLTKLERKIPPPTS